MLAQLGAKADDPAVARGFEWLQRDHKGYAPLCVANSFVNSMVAGEIP
jgi:hypothetical protein